MDGVLLDTLSLKIRAMRCAIKEDGCFTVISIQEMLGADRPSHLFDRYCKNSQRASNRFSELYEAGLRHVDRFITFSELESVRSLGCQLCIFTAQPRRRVERALADDLRLFEMIVAEEDMAAPKPDPSGLIQIAKNCPGPLLLLGDSPCDIVAGQRAGVYVVAVTWGYHSRELLASFSPDEICDDLKNLFAIVYKWRRTHEDWMLCKS